MTILMKNRDRRISSIDSETDHEQKHHKLSPKKQAKVMKDLMPLVSNVEDLKSFLFFKRKLLDSITINTKSSARLNFTQRNKWGFLHEAAKHGNVEIGRFLIFELEQDPNIISDSLWTPLQLACSEGHSKFVEMLLESDSIDPDLITNYVRGSATEISWNNILSGTIKSIKNGEPIDTINDPFLDCLKAIYKFKNKDINDNILQKIKFDGNQEFPQNNSDLPSENSLYSQAKKIKYAEISMADAVDSSPMRLPLTKRASSLEYQDSPKNNEKVLDGQISQRVRAISSFKKKAINQSKFRKGVTVNELKDKARKILSYMNIQKISEHLLD